MKLPAGVYELKGAGGEVAGYKIRWRQEGDDGVSRHCAKSFSVRKFSSLERALGEAVAYREAAIKVVAAAGAVQRADPASRMTVEELFQEWCMKHGPSLSIRYAEASVRCWDREVASRAISRVRLERLARDPAILTRFQDELAEAGIPASSRAQVLKIVRAVLRWGRRRHPNALPNDFTGLFEMPRRKGQRLPYVADAVGLERIIEAVLGRAAKDELLPIRDAALVAAMGFTVAARPSEWLYSATWGDLHEASVELQRHEGEAADEESRVGLKTGARAALLLAPAADRLAAYRAALEAKHGRQPDHGLVFQALEDGPVWEKQKGGQTRPVAWSYDHYKRWTARVWRPARQRAAGAPDAPKGLASMRFYDCRHTAISMALHSTLVMGPHGMNLHTLAGLAGHDVQTLQRHYAHIIVRYQEGEPIDLERECERARKQVAANPYLPEEPPAGPQRAAQRRRRERAQAGA